MMCGKEKFFDDVPSNQEFYLCFDCSKFWLTDYLQRLKARIVGWWRS